jgi:hypothetical protein
MKLISKEAAIAAMTLIADEVKPINGWNIPELLRALTERYEFAKSPSLQETITSGAKFEHGRLLDKNINIAELNVLGTGISAKTVDTSDSEVILKDLYGFLKKTFGFRDPISKPVHVFQSELVVEFDNNPDRTIKSFAPLTALLQKEVEVTSGIKKQFQLHRLDFASDPMEPSTINALFLIERRAAVPYASNRYFCRAYMSTDAHIRALELLDKIFSGKG